MVFGVGSNLGLGALGSSRLAGRLSPEEERQVAEWGEEWVRGWAEWRDDPRIDAAGRVLQAIPRWVGSSKNPQLYGFPALSNEYNIYIYLYSYSYIYTSISVWWQSIYLSLSLFFFVRSLWTRNEQKSTSWVSPSRASESLCALPPGRAAEVFKTLVRKYRERPDAPWAPQIPRFLG
jgi:hypothetical protein